MEVVALQWLDSLTIQNKSAHAALARPTPRNVPQQQRAVISSCNLQQLGAVLITIYYLTAHTRNLSNGLRCR